MAEKLLKETEVIPLVAVSVATPAMRELVHDLSMGTSTARGAC